MRVSWQTQAWWATGGRPAAGGDEAEAACGGAVRCALSPRPGQGFLAGWRGGIGHQPPRPAGLPQDGGQPGPGQGSSPHAHPAVALGSGRPVGGSAGGVPG